MSLFTIDEKLCERDGICVAECPAFVIEMKTKESFPTVTDGGETRCINCGHCVAVCPHRAISLARMSVDQCPPVDDGLALGEDQMEQFLRSRRSIRTYKTQDVDAETLTRLIDIARYAPTGSNSQQVQWLIVPTRDKVVQLTALAVDWMRNAIEEKNPIAEAYQMGGIVRAWDNGVDIISRGAPALIITHGPEAYPIMTIDSAIALSYLDLAAPPLGLGSCWAGFFMAAAGSWPPLAEALNFPEGHKSFGAMMVGYPKYRYHRLPMRNEAKVSVLK
ncbi:nitroreductase family protein [bacterium]|nr:nitroreductase family protein [bacterium]